MPFFTDHNVPESVCRALEGKGHKVTRLREAMPRDSADQTVAAACAAFGLVLVTHDNDFKAIARRLNVTNKKSRSLHRIQLRCPEPNSAQRITDLLPLIEFEWKRVQRRENIQLVVHINDTSIRIEC